MIVDKKYWKYLIYLAGAFVLLGLILFFYVYFGLMSDLPSLEQLENPKQNLATQILSADGEVLDHFFIQRRISSSLDSIPKDFINALVATEDKEFYNHWGVHVSRIFKAAVKNVLKGGLREGASTITMQLARNLYFTQETSFRRKMKEALTAVQIERRYTKEEILEKYINTVAFGRGAYGIQVAASIYFDKNPMELTTAECAFLVGVLKAPEHYNGVINYEKSIRRRNVVLGLMQDQGYISPSKYAEAAQEPINLATKRKLTGRGGSIAPHFVEMIRQSLNKNKLKDKDLYRDGLTIYTTLNSRIQKYALEAMDEHLNEFQKAFDRSWSWNRNRDLLETIIREAISKRSEYIAADDSKKAQLEKALRSNRAFIDSIKNSATTIQAGLVVIDPFDGSILAMVGGSPKFMREHTDAKYSLNHVTQIQRQPGSTFKPFVYSSALEKGMTPESPIECGPYTYTIPSTGEVWSPKGAGECGAGEKVSLYEALTKSINTVSARLITQVTNPSDVIRIASRMGVSSRLLAVPALSLGAGGEVIPLDMVSAFGTFVNNGVHVKPYGITRVDDQFGNMLLENKKRMEATDVLSSKICNQMIYMMQGVVNYGTGYKVREFFKNYSAAGKTGTTNDFADAWFIGYTPQLVAGLWVGFDDRRITFQNTMGYASSAAAPVWGRLMAKIYADETLPYKQKEFTYMVTDSTDSNFVESKIVSQMNADKKPQVQTANENQNNNDKKQKDEQKTQKHEAMAQPKTQTPKPKFPKLPKADANKVK